MIIDFFIRFTSFRLNFYFLICNDRANSFRSFKFLISHRFIFLRNYKRLEKCKSFQTRGHACLTTGQIRIDHTSHSTILTIDSTRISFFFNLFCPS
ncbi:MAG: hypothetical protein A2V86_04695 [Deltaproteobacteria bacterium RBG_16_49_23]|nr:MAG: hypothetical protein A2V86_04695 [Deltaproteobacteria bacterium RBG_16_49_23]